MTPWACRLQGSLLKANHRLLFTVGSFLKVVPEEGRSSESPAFYQRPTWEGGRSLGQGVCEGEGL